MLDGVRGRSNFRLGGWQGYQGKDFRATIDLMKLKDIHKVSVGFLQDTRAWIIFPTSMTVEVSEDNIHFEPYGTFVNQVPANDYEEQIQEFTVNKDAKCRYIRITAKTFGKLPEWHLGAGGDSHIFVDEVTVE